MKKPAPAYQHGKCYLYNEIREWIKFKYKRDIDNWNEGTEKPFLCFWHWVCDNCDTHSGGVFEIPLGDRGDYSQYAEVFEALEKEFGGEEPCRVVHFW